MKTRLLMLFAWPVVAVSVRADNIRLPNAVGMESSTAVCLAGNLSQCDKTLLAPESASILSNASEACLSGTSSACDQSLLNPASAAALDNAAKEGQLQVCDNPRWCGSDYRPPAGHATPRTKK